MKNLLPNPRSSAFLVDVADTHALVDAAGERLFVLNAAGAESWRSLNAGNPPRTRSEHAFACELADLGLLPEPVAFLNHDDASAARDTDPRILSKAPLQVAANTSDPDPFSADSIW
jgi:hypothetical protein